MNHAHLDETVVTSGCDPSTVRTELERVDGVRVSLVVEYATFATQIP